MMTTLSLVVDRDDEVNELDYLLEHYHDYDPEEWEAQYEQLTEIAVLEDQIRERKQQLIRNRTALLD
ncbi:MAG: hypothetical protein K6L76_01840 [Agarilytica sp.]